MKLKSSKIANLFYFISHIVAEFDSNKLHSATVLMNKTQYFSCL